MTAAQCIRARKNAQHDKRYSSTKAKDVNVRARRAADKVAAERMRQQRSKGKKG